MSEGVVRKDRALTASFPRCALIEMIDFPMP